MWRLIILSKIFTKPNDYEKWLNSNISRSKWPKEIYRYHANLLKFKGRHPEAVDMTPEQIDEYRAKLRLEAADKRQTSINIKLDAMTPEERAAFNKKKGSFYNNYCWTSNIFSTSSSGNSISY